MIDMFNQMRYTFISDESKVSFINKPKLNNPQSKTKADIETGNTIEYDFTSYQVK